MENASTKQDILHVWERQVLKTEVRVRISGNRKNLEICLVFSWTSSSAVADESVRLATSRQRAKF